MDLAKNFTLALYNFKIRSIGINYMYLSVRCIREHVYSSDCFACGLCAVGKRNRKTFGDKVTEVKFLVISHRLCKNLMTKHAPFCVTSEIFKHQCFDCSRLLSSVCVINTLSLFFRLFNDRKNKSWMEYFNKIKTHESNEFSLFWVVKHIARSV